MSSDTDNAYAAGYEKRRRELRDAIASRLTVEQHSIWSIHAAMRAAPPAEALNRIVERGIREVEGGAGELAGGPFETLPAMALLCRWQSKLPPEAVARIKRLFVGGVQERGNTENHWLMFYVGNLLAAERWSEEDALWNGLSPTAIREEATRWLRGMIERTALYGHHEYDSTWYHLEHLLGWIVLSDHAADASLRDEARKMLDLLVLDMALEYFHGAWAGGHSREGYRMNTQTRLGPVIPLQYLYFGGEEFQPEVHVHPWAAIALESGYRPPAMLADIAWDYATPHAVKKTRAPRTIYRHANRDAAPVRKYTWRSPSFALGTTQLGLPGAPAGPIDLTSWDLSWNAPNQQGKLVCNHPYRSPGRFSAFLCDLPQISRRTIGQGKPYLQFPDRLFGASPFERMMQHQGTAIVLYRIPPDDEAPYVNVFLPRGLAWVERGRWLMADAGKLFIAVWVIGAYRWDEIVETSGNPFMVTQGDLVDGWLLKVETLDCGLILEAVESAEAGSFTAFCDRRAALVPELHGWPADGRVAVQTTTGHRLQMSYDGPHLVDGEPIDYDAWPLYEAPWAKAAVGTGRIHLKRSGTSHDLDFRVDPSGPHLPMRVIG